MGLARKLPARDLHLLNTPHTFAAARDMDIPLSKEAARFYQCRAVHQGSQPERQVAL